MGPTPRKHPTRAWSASADSCGCAMGARFLGVALFASIVWCALHRREYSLVGAGVRILVVSFAGAILGKLVGIAVYQFRARMSRDAVAESARPSPPLPNQSRSAKSA